MSLRRRESSNHVILASLFPGPMVSTRQWHHRLLPPKTWFERLRNASCVPGVFGCAASTLLLFTGVLGSGRHNLLNRNKQLPNLFSFCLPTDSFLSTDRFYLIVKTDPFTTNSVINSHIVAAVRILKKISDDIGITKGCQNLKT